MATRMATLRARMTRRAVQRVATKKARVRVVALPARRLPAPNLPKVLRHPQQRSSYVSLGRVQPPCTALPSYSLDLRRLARPTRTNVNAKKWFFSEGKNIFELLF